VERPLPVREKLGEVSYIPHNSQGDDRI
jgi:hypothetical protein